jgi:hypothetical protein
VKGDQREEFGREGGEETCDVYEDVLGGDEYDMGKLTWLLG